MRRVCEHLEAVSAYALNADEHDVDMLQRYIDDTCNGVVMRSDRGAPIVVAAAVSAYIAGTTLAVENVNAQLDSSADDNVWRQPPEAVINSHDTSRRVGVIRSTVASAIAGVAAAIAKRLKAVIMPMLRAGDPPTEAVTRVREQALPAKSEAMRTAIAEINDAHRQAVIDHDVQVRSEGYYTRMLHLSALLPTTRRHHASRHGHAYTAQEVADWYAKDGNRYNCHCTQVTVIVDEHGVPINPRSLMQLTAERERYLNQRTS